MSPEQKRLVTDTWLRLAPNGEAAAGVFYDRLFEIDATTRPLFRDADLQEQRRKLAAALGMVVAGLGDIEALAPRLAELGQRHTTYGVTDAHYDSVGAALLWTLEQGLKSSWTADVAAAWSAAYAAATQLMRRPNP